MTLLELLVVLVIAAILVGLAGPSFDSMLARKRLEGVASELATDLQYARTEAVQRQESVRLASSSTNGCYVVHTVPAGGTCSCSAGAAPTCSGGAVPLKSTDLARGVVLASKTVDFDPVRGMTASGAGAPGFELSSSQGNWQLRTSLTLLGRVQTCTVNITLRAYPACTP